MALGKGLRWGEMAAQDQGGARLLKRHHQMFPAPGTMSDKHWARGRRPELQPCSAGP